MGDYFLTPRMLRGSVEIPGADIRGSQRASDADRTRYIRLLGRCHEEGRIDGDVFNARMEAAAECTTVEQLAVLISDLPPIELPLSGLRARFRRIGRTTLGRRWLHTAVAAAVLCWAIIIPAVIFNVTGFQVAYKTGSDSWIQIDHHGPALALVWFFIITGICGFVVNILWWLEWETRD